MTAPVERPQPVLNAAKLGGLVSGAVVAVGGAYFVVAQGITQDNLSVVGLAMESAITAVIALVVYAVAVIHGKAAAAAVTPLESPVNAAGQPLVPDTFPADAWAAWLEHPRSKPRTDALVTAVKAWRGEEA